MSNLQSLIWSNIGYTLLFLCVTVFNCFLYAKKHNRSNTLSFILLMAICVVQLVKHIVLVVFYMQCQNDLIGMFEHHPGVAAFVKSMFFLTSGLGCLLMFVLMKCFTFRKPK